MFSSSKPYTAVTVYVERLTGPEYQENDLSGIVDMIEAIRLQGTGPTEAARALRKKLKYGDTHRQLRALTILDGLIQNAGNRFQKTFADEPLLERLRILPREAVDPEVRDKCNTLFKQWATQFKGQPGLGGIATLYKELPKTSRMTASQSRVIQETERDLDNDNENPFADDEDDQPAPPPDRRKLSISQLASAAVSSSSPSKSSSMPWSRSSGGGTEGSTPKSSKKDRSGKKRKPFNLEKERPEIMQTIAAANVTATNLLNSLKLINRETERVSSSYNVIVCFETCKRLRRQILRYIQVIEGDQLIGSLLSANDELVNALMAFEIMDKSVEDDSDSETENVAAAAAATTADTGPASSSSVSTTPVPVPGHARKTSRIEEDLAGLNFQEQPPPKPPRPGTTPTAGGPAPIATPLASAGARPPPAMKRHNEPNDNLDEADENDPFGDQHEIA